MLQLFESPTSIVFPLSSPCVTVCGASAACDWDPLESDNRRHVGQPPPPSKEIKNACSGKEHIEQHHFTAPNCFAPQREKTNSLFWQQQIINISFEECSLHGGVSALPSWLSQSRYTRPQRFPSEPRFWLRTWCPQHALSHIVQYVDFQYVLSVLSFHGILHVLDMSGRSEVWSSSHYMSRKQFVWSTSSGVGGKVLVTGQVRLFSLNDRQATPWFSSPLPDLILRVTVTVMTVTLSEWERHSERHPFWLTALRHCRCRFITRSKRPVQCLGQNDRHVTSKHGVGFDTIQKVKLIYKFDFVL